MWAASAVSDEDRLDRAETGRVLRRSLQFAQPYRRGIGLAVALVAVSTVCALTGPVLVKIGLDRGIKDRSTSALDTAVARLRRGDRHRVRGGSSAVPDDQPRR